MILVLPQPKTFLALEISNCSLTLGWRIVIPNRGVRAVVQRLCCNLKPVQGWRLSVFMALEAYKRSWQALQVKWICGFWSFYGTYCCPKWEDWQHFIVFLVLKQCGMLKLFWWLRGAHSLRRWGTGSEYISFAGRSHRRPSILKDALVFYRNLGKNGLWSGGRQCTW